MLAGYQYHLALQNRDKGLPPADIHFIYDDLDGPHQTTCNGSVLIVPEGKNTPLEPYYMTDLV